MNKDEEMLNSNTEQNNEDLDSDNQEEESEDLDSTTQDDSTEGKNLEELNKQLYSRTKKAESELKRMRAQVESFKKAGESVTNEPTKVDEFELTKLVHALRDFNDDKELEIVKRQAKGLGVSLTEAATHEDTMLLVESYRKKQQDKQAVPETSSRQQPYEKAFNEWTPADINTLMDDGSEESNKKLDDYYKWAKNN